MLAHTDITKKIEIGRDEFFIFHNPANFTLEHDGENKLHLAIHRSEYLNFTKSEDFQKILSLLDKAIIEAQISGFKFFDPESIGTYEAHAYSVVKTEHTIQLLENLLTIEFKKYTADDISNYKYYIKEDFPFTPKYLYKKIKDEIDDLNRKLVIRKRNFSNPIIFYLPKKADENYILNLCEQLQALLKTLPLEDNSLYGELDLPTKFSHISFRQDRINGVYVAVSEATQEELTQLKELGEQSPIYLALSNNKSIPLYPSKNYSHCMWCPKKIEWENESKWHYDPHLRWFF